MKKHTVSDKYNESKYNHLLTYLLTPKYPRSLRERDRERGKKAGFTLAEVLITLGIIGVVAAMTIPNLISNYSKHIVESNLKETYSILQQTLKFTEYDDVSFEMELPDNMESSKKWFETYLAPHMKYSTVCYNKSGCWNDKGLTRTLSGGVPYTYRSQIGIGSDIIIIKLTNGSNLIVDGYSAGSIYNYFGVKISDPSSIILFIDGNGDRPPNIIGQDIYAAVFTSDGVVPAGNSMTNEDVNKNCSKLTSGNNAGYFCLTRVKNNGWEIPSDVWRMKVKR